MNKVLTIRIPEKTYNELSKQAKAEKTSMATVIRKKIEDPADNLCLDKKRLELVNRLENIGVMAKKAFLDINENKDDAMYKLIALNKEIEWLKERI